MIFVLLLLVLSALDGVQLNTPDLGPDFGTVKPYVTKGVKLIRKTLPQDVKLYGVYPRQSYNTKVVESPAHDNANLVPKHTTVEPRRFYEDIVLVMGATSAGVTMMLALFLLCYVIITGFRRRRASIRRQRAQRMEANRAMSQPPPPPSVLESENLSKIEFTFETEKTLPKNQKPIVTAEKTYTKCQTIPKLPVKQRKRATERNGSVIWTSEDMELPYYRPERDLADECVRHYVSPPARRMVTTRAEVHAPPKGEIL